MMAMVPERELMKPTLIESPEVSTQDSAPPPASSPALAPQPVNNSRAATAVTAPDVVSVVRVELDLIGMSLRWSKARRCEQCPYGSGVFARCGSEEPRVSTYCAHPACAEGVSPELLDRFAFVTLRR